MGFRGIPSLLAFREGGQIKVAWTMLGVYSGAFLWFLFPLLRDQWTWDEMGWIKDLSLRLGSGRLFYLACDAHLKDMASRLPRDVLGAFEFFAFFSFPLSILLSFISPTLAIPTLLSIPNRYLSTFPMFMRETMPYF